MKLRFLLLSHLVYKSLFKKNMSLTAKKDLVCHRKHNKDMLRVINKLFQLTLCFSLLELMSNQRRPKICRGKVCRIKNFGKIWGNSGKIFLATPKICLLLHPRLRNAGLVFGIVLFICMVIRKNKI